MGNTMDKAEIYKHVDHTQLKAFAVWDDYVKLCDEATRYRCASVCVPPSQVAAIRERYPELTICTVVGFPLGYSVTAAKVAEVEKALADGADEIDMVIDIADTKNHYYDKVQTEINALRAATGNKILKVIIETCYLDRDEKIRLCEIVTAAKADFIKTSTGFGTAGATLEDVELFKQHIGPSVRIKAAGGIRSVEDMERFLAAGCARLGTSSAVQLLESGAAGAGY